MRPYITTYQAIALLDAPKIHTDIIWDLTILLGSIALIYFTAIFFFRNKMSGKSRKVSALKPQLSPMISEFIFYEEDASKEEKSHYIDLKVQIRDMLRDDFTRKVVSEILLDLRKDVSGSAQVRLFELFQDLDLHKASYAKLKSWRWEQISRGIQELTRMEVSESYDFITKFINDNRSTIRKQAEIAVVTLNPEGINYFLDTTTHKISEWQQLKLMEVLSNKTEFVPPSFMAWLTSTNKFVVLFALRLIKYYDQNDARASIIELVKHRNNQIKQEALDCIRSFYIVEALPTLKKIFWSCTTDVKISILGTIGELGAPKDIPFLKSIGNKERSYAVTSKALSAINSIVPESILPTKGIADIEDIPIPEDVRTEETEIPVSKLKEEEIGEQVEVAFVESATKPSDSTKEIAKQIEVVAEEPSVPISDLSDEDVSQQLESDTPTLEDTAGDRQEPATVAEAAIVTTYIREIKVAFSDVLIPQLEEIRQQDQVNTKEIMETPLNNIEVVFEEVLWKYIPKEATTKTLDINDMLVVSTDLDFLPIVVAEQADIPANGLEEGPEEKETMPSEEPFCVVQEVVDIHELLIDYQEIEFVPIEEEKKVEDQEQEHDAEVVAEVRGLEVIFEEVFPPKMEAPIANEVHDKAHFDFEVVFNNEQPPLTVQKGETSFLEIEVDAIEVETLPIPLSEMQVVYAMVCAHKENDEKGEEDLPLWLLNEISKEGSEAPDYQTIQMEGPEWNQKEAQMMDKIKSYFDLLPKSEDYDSEISESVRILDDIDLFGDEREIPLLQELMKKEDKTATKERIDALMRRFMGTDAYGSVDIDTKPYSVFEELFRNCDTESKLILLDEIVAIGDKKEIYFLEELVHDSNKKIRVKAERALKLLKERFLNIESGLVKSDTDEYENFLNMMELRPPKESDLFHIDFELNTEENETVDDAPAKSSWFSSLLSKFNKKQTDS